MCCEKHFAPGSENKWHKHQIYFQFQFRQGMLEKVLCSQNSSYNNPNYVLVWKSLTQTAPHFFNGSPQTCSRFNGTWIQSGSLLTAPYHAWQLHLVYDLHPHHIYCNILQGNFKHYIVSQFVLIITLNEAHPINGEDRLLINWIVLELLHCPIWHCHKDEQSRSFKDFSTFHPHTTASQLCYLLPFHSLALWAYSEDTNWRIFENL